MAIACNKNEFMYSRKVDDVINMRSGNGTDNARMAFARTLARALTNADIRAYIRDKITGLYDNADDMIYLKYKDSTLNGQKLSYILKNYAEPSILNQYGEDFFDNDVVNTCPLLSMKVVETDVVDIEDWSFEYLPAVFVPLSNDSIWISVRADSTLQVIAEVHIDDPEYITISVGDSEANYLVRSDGSLYGGGHIRNAMPSIQPISIDSGEIQYRNEPYDPCFYLYEQAITSYNQYLINGQQFYLVNHDLLLAEYYECIEANFPPNPGSNPPLSSSSCDRDNDNFDEILSGFKLNNWSVFNAIRNQKGESEYKFHANFVLITVRQDNPSSPFSAFSLRFVTPLYNKSDLMQCRPRPCQGKWKGANYRIWRDWNLFQLAEPYVVDWSEVDDEVVTTSFTMGLSVSARIGDATNFVTIGRNMGLTISRVGDKTVLLGSSPVFYCDPFSLEYNTGNVTFKVR